MKINDKQFITMDSEKANESKKAEARRATAAKKDAGKSAASNSAVDTVALSSRARDIADIALQLKQSADVREELVNELKQKIQDGTYHVSGLEIANAIVDKAKNDIY